MERVACRRCLTISVFVWQLLLVASDMTPAEADKDLERIKKRIENEKRGISQARKKEGSILHALGVIEGALEKKTVELNRANSKLDSIAVEIKKKEREREKIQAAVGKRQELLKRRAAALYRWHRGGSPFLLFNGGASLGEFLRRKRYLQTTMVFDQELVQALNAEAARQQALKEELARKKEELDNQRQALVEIKDSVRKEGEKKRELLASVRQEKDARERAVKELEQAALRLQKMIDEIAKRSSSKPQDTPAGTGFESLRGKLDLPVRGVVSEGFGKTKHPEFSTDVFRKGVDFQAPLGGEIRAVEKGRVVFADRFAGYGKMLIIDHGERYYTIYAHLSDFVKKTGDAVKRGEAIGWVGESDSLAGAKLYFEMRKDGKSIDPVPWFRRQ